MALASRTTRKGHFPIFCLCFEQLDRFQSSGGMEQSG